MVSPVSSSFLLLKPETRSSSPDERAFLASRGLFAELDVFMLHGISELPEIIIQAKGKPAFQTKNLPLISYAGNMVGGVDHRRRVRAGYGITAHLPRLSSAFARTPPLSPVMKTYGQPIKTIPTKGRAHHHIAPERVKTPPAMS